MLSATETDIAAPQMQKREERMADGRLIIYYSFASKIAEADKKSAACQEQSQSQDKTKKEK